MASLLEVFGITFEADTEDVEKATQRVGRELDEIEKTIKKSSQEAVNFGDSLNSLGNDAQTAALSLSSFGGKDLELSSKIAGIKELQEAFADLSDQESAELGEKLGFDSKTISQLKRGDAAIDDLVKSIDDLEKKGKSMPSLGSVVGSVAAAFGAFSAAVVSTAGATDEIGKFSETLGLNIEDVGAWSEAVVRSGGDAGAFQGSIQALTGQLTDFELTGGGAVAETFARMGINAVDAGGKVKGAFDVLPELADRFSQMDKQKAFSYGQKLGLDQGTILLLQQGRQGVEALVDRQKQLGVATQEDYEIAAKFNDQWADTKQVFSSLFQAAGTTILPMLTSMLGGLEDVIGFVKENEVAVGTFFTVVGGAVLAYYVPSMIAAAASTWAMMAPVLAVVVPLLAIGAAIALVVDDIYNFIQGNDSLIGQISKDYPIVGEIATALADTFNAAISGLGWIGEFLVNLFTSPKEAINQLAELVDSVIGGISEKVSGVTGFVSDLLGSDDDDMGAKASVEKNIKKGNRIISGVNSNPLNGATSGSINNSQSKQVNNSFDLTGLTIQTQATDAQGIANDIGKSLQQQLANATNNLDDGVAG